MEREGGEVHVTTNEARSGRTGTGVRNVLVLSLLLVIIALSAIWIYGALKAPQGSHAGAVSNQAPPTAAP